MSTFCSMGIVVWVLGTTGRYVFHYLTLYIPRYNSDKNHVASSLKRKKKQAKKVGLYFWQGKLKLMKFSHALQLLLDLQCYPRISQQQNRCFCPKTMGLGHPTLRNMRKIPKSWKSLKISIGLVPVLV